MAPELGRGEITAAMGALENLISVVTPVIWATLYAYFMSHQPGSPDATTVALLLGPGGHFILAGVSLPRIYALPCARFHCLSQGRVAHFCSFLGCPGLPGAVELGAVDDR